MSRSLWFTLMVEENLLFWFPAGNKLFQVQKPILVQMLRTKLGAQMGTELVLCQGKKSAMKTIKE